MWNFEDFELADLEKLEEAWETIFGLMGDRDDEMMFELKNAIDVKEEAEDPTVTEIAQTK